MTVLIELNNKEWKAKELVAGSYSLNRMSDSLIYVSESADGSNAISVKEPLTLKVESNKTIYRKSYVESGRISISDFFFNKMMITGGGGTPSPYVLPVATTKNLGGIKLGTNDGTINANAEGVGTVRGWVNLAFKNTSNYFSGGIIETKATNTQKGSLCLRGNGANFLSFYILDGIQMCGYIGYSSGTHDHIDFANEITGGFFRFNKKIRYINAPTLDNLRDIPDKNYVDAQITNLRTELINLINTKADK